MFISDIDGTLLNSEAKVSKQNIKALWRLKKQDIPIVLATGRNLFSVKKVIPNDFPIDYLIFSTGLGILDWKTKNIIYQTKLDTNILQTTIKQLIEKKISFFLQNEIPDNHFFYSYKNGKPPLDFYRRASIYKNFILKNKKISELKNISQIIAILENNHDLSEFESIEGLKKIRSSSPLDHKSIWLEFFPPHISKGFAIKWLCDYLNIEYSQTLSIGNDYNDLEMLKFTNKSYCVANAPEEIKKKFTTLLSNNENGVSQAVKEYEIYLI